MPCLMCKLNIPAAYGPPSPFRHAAEGGAQTTALRRRDYPAGARGWDREDGSSPTSER